MSLEKLLAPIQKIDESALKFYTRRVENWENKGGNKYVLAQILNATATMANAFYLILQGSYVVGLPIFAVQSSETTRNIYEKNYSQDSTSGAVAQLPSGLQKLKKIADYTRLPFLVSGLALLGRGLYGLAEFVMTRETAPLADAIMSLSVGYGLLGTASSMYIKESDPKLLDKEPEHEISSIEVLQPIPIRKK